MGHTYRIFFIVLGLWEASKPTKKILAQSEKIRDGIHYGLICPDPFGHIIIIYPLQGFTGVQISRVEMKNELQICLFEGKFDAPILPA